MGGHLRPARRRKKRWKVLTTCGVFWIGAASIIMWLNIIFIRTGCLKKSCREPLRQGNMAWCPSTGIQCGPANEGFLYFARVRFVASWPVLKKGEAGFNWFLCVVLHTVHRPGLRSATRLLVFPFIEGFSPLLNFHQSTHINERNQKRGREKSLLTKKSRSRPGSPPGWRPASFGPGTGRGE